MHEHRESADPATDRERAQGDGNSLADLERNDARNRPQSEGRESTARREPETARTLKEGAGAEPRSD